MSNFFRNKGRGSHQLNLSGNTSYYIADVNELNGLVIGTDLVASAYVFDPRTGKVWQLTTGTITSGSGLITAGATDETAAGVPDGTVTNSILRWNGSAWVEESDITVDASGNVSTSGTVTSTNSTASTNKDTGAIVTEGGIGAEGNINAGGNLAAVGSVTGGTGVTATTGDVTATAGNLVATAGVLDINGTGASDIAGTLSVGSGTTSGTLTLTDGTDSVVLQITNIGSDSGKLAIGSSYTAPTEDQHASPKKYVDDQVSSVVAGVSWKGHAKALSGENSITDGTASYDLHAAGVTAGTTTVTLNNATTGLDNSLRWYFEDDNSPITVNIRAQANGVSGTDYDLIVGDYFITTNEAGTEQKLWMVESTADAGNSLVVKYMSLIQEKDSFGVSYDMTQAVAFKEGIAALYVANVSDVLVKIGELAVGQIQNGTTADTLPVWSTADSTWKQFNTLTLTNSSGFDGFATTNGIALSGTNGTYLYNSNPLGSNIALGVSTDSTNEIRIVNTTTSKRVSIESGGKDGSDIGVRIYQDPTVSDADVQIANSSSNGLIMLNTTGSDLVVLNQTPTDVNTGTSSYSVVDVNYVRANVVQRQVNASVANAGTQALTVDADAVKFYVKVKGNTTEADVYASEIMAVVNSGSTVDATEYAIVGNAALASITIARVSATSISCTVTNNTGETATVAIHAIPIR